MSPKNVAVYSLQYFQGNSYIFKLIAKLITALMQCKITSGQNNLNSVESYQRNSRSPKAQFYPYWMKTKERCQQEKDWKRADSMCRKEAS